MTEAPEPRRVPRLAYVVELWLFVMGFIGAAKAGQEVIGGIVSVPLIGLTVRGLVNPPTLASKRPADVLPHAALAIIGVGLIFSLGHVMLHPIPAMRLTHGVQQLPAAAAPRQLAGSLIAALSKGGRVDLRETAKGQWDRLAFFWYASPEAINEKLGFAWTHPDSKNVDLFDGRHLVLFAVVRDKMVVDHILVSEKELTSCVGAMVVDRANAVFSVDQHVACVDGEKPGARPR